MIIPIVFATDDNYVLPLCVAIKSIINNKNKEDELKIYVFNSGLNNENVAILNSFNSDSCTIQLIDVSKYLNETKSSIYAMGRFPISACFRFFIPQILYEYDKVIYLDCDVLVMQSLKELYCVDLTNVLCAANNMIVGENFENKDYFNSGVLVVNNKEFIKQDAINKCLDYMKKNKELSYPDEMALNYVCKDKVKFIDTKYNFQTTYAKEKKSLIATKVKRINDIVIIHYTDKPWKYVNTIFAKYWWNTVKTLPKDLQFQIQTKFSKDYDINGQVFGYYKYYFANPVKKFFIKINSKLKKNI